MPEITQVRAARHHAIEVVQSWKLDGDDGGLVTTELAANAVLHGQNIFNVAQSTFSVALRHDEELVTIEVGDSNPRMPRFCVQHVHRP